MLLLTGVTGKTGGEVATQLAAAGTPFRALIRNPDKADKVRKLGGEVVIGDISDVAALSAAFDGVSRALLIMPNEENQLVLERQFTDAAVSAGVKHLVYLSSLESVPESTNPITRNHVAAEAWIRNSGMAWTMIRPTFFMQMFAGMAASIADKHRIVMPCGQGTVATTDLRDVGAVIVKVMTETGHEYQSYDLTGPELLTMGQIAERFSEVLGTRIEYIDQPPDEFRARLQQVGLSDWRVEAVCLEFDAIARGAIDHTTGVIERLLGQPPTSLTQYIEDYADLFGGRQS